MAGRNLFATQDNEKKVGKNLFSKNNTNQSSVPVDQPQQPSPQDINPRKLALFAEAQKRGLIPTDTRNISQGSPYKQPQAIPPGTNEETWQQIASQYGHEYLPTVSGMAGSVVGGGGALVAGQLGPQIATPEEIATVPIGISAGGAAGFALGEQFADVLDEMLGIVPERTFKESAETAAENIYAGSEAEAIGLGIAAPISAAVKRFAPSVRNMFRPNEEKVGSQLAKMSSPLDAQNIADANRLKESIPGTEFTYGMGTGNKDITSLERGAIASAGKEGLGNVQTMASDIQQGNVQAVTRAIDDLSPGTPQQFKAEVARQSEGINTVMDKASAIDTQATGTQIREALSEAKSPVQKMSQQMEGDIPKYAIEDISGVSTSFDEVLKDQRIPASSRKNVESFKSLFNDEVKKFGKNTHTLFGLRRELNSRISQAEATGDTWTSSTLQSIRKGIEDDISKLGEKARTGKLFVYKGNVVNPDDLASELETNLVDLAKLKQSKKIDYQRMREDLKSAGVPPEMYMRHQGVSEQGANESLIKLYQSRVGEPPVTVPDGVPKQIASLEERNGTIKNILNELEPGRDVASAINAYNRYTRQELFGRFDTDAISAAKNGVLRPENVPAKFTTLSGADELINALGNKQQAADFMWQHYDSEIGKLGADFTDKKAKDWLRSNRQTLKKYGLIDEASRKIKSITGKQQLDKILKTDINSVFDSIISGNKRTQKEALMPIMQKIKGNQEAMEGLQASFRDYIKQRVIQPRTGGYEGFGRVEKLFSDIEPTMDILFSPQQKAKVSDIRDAVALTQKMTAGTPLGNSQTTELANQAKTALIEGRKVSPTSRTLSGIFASALGYSVGGPYGAMAAVGPTIGLQEYLKKMGNEKVRRYLVEAMFNPEYAQTLISASRKRKLSKEMTDTITRQATRASIYQTMTGGQQTQDEVNQ